MACARRQAWSTCRAPRRRAERRFVSIFFCAQKNQLKKIFQCSEFPTAVNGNGNAVCGVSDLPGTGCSAGKTFQEALSLCVGAGARLCTLQEVLDNEVRLSGCNNFEAARVWTSTREECPQDHVKTTGDHDARASATRRPACTPITESFNMAVRCCADVEHLCEAGLPCHPVL